jgi:hypothetical protein
MVFPHLMMILEFLHLMELLVQHQGDILQVAAVEQKMELGDLAAEVVERVQLLDKVELQVLLILVVVEEEEMLRTDLVVSVDQEL